MTLHTADCQEVGLEGLPTTDEPLPGSKVSGTGKRVGEGQEHANTHPTVKPIELLRWLVRLLSRPGQMVLDPFGGSGTTAIACVLEGRRWIAIERDPDYARIASARIAWWEREARRKPGRSVSQILGEGPRVRTGTEVRQGVLL